MKKFNLILIFLIFTVVSAFSQVHNPVEWTVGSKKINSKEAVVFIKANVESGWHIYGTSVPAGGPVSTKFTFQPSKEFSVNGKTVEPKAKKKFEDVFKMEVPYHDGEAIFQQKVKLNSNKPVTVSGTVEFMACDKSQCLPPDEYSFKVTVK